MNAKILLEELKREISLGELTYLCPCKSPDEESVCFFCVCRPAPERGEP